MWGLKEFTWEVFDRLVTEARAYAEHSSAGGHIHMSKDAWDTAALWKLLQLHRYQAHFCGLIGGRGCGNSYASFFSDCGGPVHLSGKQLMDTAKAKQWRLTSSYNPRGYGNRYVAVNLNPESTIELRYPQGTIVPSKIRKNIQWAHALWSFCTQTNLKQFKSALNEVQSFVAWVKERGDQYPELVAYMDDKADDIDALTPSHVRRSN
jgi:hypothetical protein